MDFLDHRGQKFFRERHQIILVSISPIKLTSCELWVVSQINTFIAELLANLENTIHASNNQHLQVELWSNSHKKLHVKIVMESLKRLGCGATSDHVHHRCLNFCKVTLAQEVAKEVKNRVSCAKYLLNWVVKNQVEIALSIPSVLSQDLGLTALWLGHHMHAVGKTDDLGGSHRKLIGL